MSEPKYCPNCAALLSEGRAVQFSRAGPVEARPLGSPLSYTDVSGGWYCYCAACKWSGDILPDDEAT